MVIGFENTDKFAAVAHHQIPIWYMAFALETSVEGLMYTAKQRKMEVDKFDKAVDGVKRKWGSIDGFEFDIGKQEEQHKLAMERYKEKYHERSLREIGV